VESEDVTGGGALDGAAWDVVEVPGALWLRIGASLDEDAAGQLGGMLAERQDRQALLVVDLRSLSTLDAGALTVIVRARRRARRLGRALAVLPSPATRPLLEAVGLGGAAIGLVSDGTWRPWGAVLVA
jgi:anti-anti-sigma regulatory factor